MNPHRAVEQPTTTDIEAIANLISADGLYAQGHGGGGFLSRAQEIAMSAIVSDYLARFVPSPASLRLVPIKSDG